MKALCQSGDKAIATQKCVCAGPPGNYCHTCFLAHLERFHSIPATTNAEDISIICAGCSTNKADVFCICVDTLPPVCSKCEGTHMAQKRLLHWLFPIAEKVRIDTASARDFVRRKVHYYLSACAKLEDNFTKLKDCRKAIINNFASLRDNVDKILEKEKNRELNELASLEQLMTEEFELGVKEVNEHLLDECYRSESDIAQALFSYNCLEDMDSLDFFRYERSRAGVDCLPMLGVAWESRLLGSHKVRNSWIRVGPRHLPLVTTNHLSFYTPATKKKVQISLSAAIPNAAWAGWAVMPNGDVVVVGFYVSGSSGSTSSFCIQQNGKIRPIAMLPGPKYGPGVICVENAVYCLGGYHGSALTSCEKYTPDIDAWTSLPNMSAGRYYYTPCECRRLIYLFGGNTLDCSVFSPLDNVHTTLNFRMPESSNTTAIAYMGEIYVFSSYHVKKYNPVSQQSQVEISGVAAFASRCTPVIVDSQVFLIQFGGSDAVRQLDLSSFTFGDNIAIA